MRELAVVLQPEGRLRDEEADVEALCDRVRDKLKR
jgi:hypothetical protein